VGPWAGVDGWKISPPPGFDRGPSSPQLSRYRAHTYNIRIVYFMCMYPYKRAGDSSVGIATRYLLDGPGIESRWRERFSTLGPT